MAPFLGTVLSRYCIGGYMSDETRGREDAAQDAEACAEALESLDRIALDELSLSDLAVDAQDEMREGTEDEAATPKTLLTRPKPKRTIARTTSSRNPPREKRPPCLAACLPMTRSPASFLAWVLRRPSTRPSPWAIFPCRPFPRHAKPRLAITRCRPSDAI